MKKALLDCPYEILSPMQQPVAENHGFSSWMEWAEQNLISGVIQRVI